MPPAHPAAAHPPGCPPARALAHLPALQGRVDGSCSTFFLVHTFLATLTGAPASLAWQRAAERATPPLAAPPLPAACRKEMHRRELAKLKRAARGRGEVEAGWRESRRGAATHREFHSSAARARGRWCLPLCTLCLGHEAGQVARHLVPQLLQAGGSCGERVGGGRAGGASAARWVAVLLEGACAPCLLLFLAP